MLDGAPLNVKKTVKSDKRVRTGTDEAKKRSASEGESRLCDATAF